MFSCQAIAALTVQVLWPLRDGLPSGGREMTDARVNALLRLALLSVALLAAQAVRASEIVVHVHFPGNA